MAVAFDAVGPSSSGFTTTTNSSLSWSHTSGSGAGTVLVFIAVGLNSATAGQVGSFSAVTYNGNTMTLLGSRAANDGSGTGGGCFLYGITGQSGGGSVTVSLGTYTPPSGSGFVSLEGASLSFTGAGSFGTAVTAPTTGVGAQASGSVAVATSSGSQVFGGFCSGTGTQSITAGTQRFLNSFSSSSAAGNFEGATSAGTGGTVTVTGAWASDWWSGIGVEVRSSAAAIVPVNLVQRGGRAFRHRYNRNQVAPLGPPPIPVVNAQAGVAVAAGVATQETVPGGSVPCITGLHSTSGASYFVDQNGSPKLLICDNPWAIIAQAGTVAGSAASWQSDMDNYLTTRAGQGVNGVYLSPYGCGNNFCTFTDGRNINGDYPFNSGSSNDPSSGLNSAFWTKVDHFLTKAQSLGITVLLNIGYSGGTADMDAGGCLNGKTATQYQNYGAALATRYASQPNLIWIVGNDYFGTYDSAYSSILTGLRGAGDTHLIAIHNNPETTSRFDLSNNSVMTWGTSNSQFNFLYTYDCEYLAAEYAYAETSPLTVFQGDGYYYQGGSTYLGGSSFAYDRSVRQEMWWSLTSGARGHNTGDEGVWKWTSGAQSQAATGWFFVNNIGNIRSAIEALPGWYLLAPATGSTLITSGRGTRATQFTSGGSGGQYEPAYSNSYVSASITPTGSLAIMYLPNAATITIDQTQVGGAGNYTAQRMDPISGALTTVTAGSTYNSGSWGNNSKGDPDWVLVLSSVTGVNASAGVAVAAGAVTAPQVSESVNAGPAGAAGAVTAPVASGGISAVAATSAGTAVQPSLTQAVSVSPPAASAAGVAVAPSLTQAVSVSAGVAAGASAVTSPGASEGINAGIPVAAGTAVAPSLTEAVTVTAGVAVAGGAALQATAGSSLTVNAGIAASTVTANPPSLTQAVSVTAGAAAAAGSVTAPSAALSGNAGIAATTVVAGAPGITQAVSAVVAAGTGAAIAAVPSVTVRAGAAQSGGVAPQPVAGAVVSASAAAAAGTGTALAPVASLSAHAAVASAGAQSAQASVTHGSARANVDYRGSTLANSSSTLGGTVTTTSLSGTLAVTANAKSGTLAVTANTLSGTVSNVNAKGGTVSLATLSGTLSVAASTLSATATGDRSQEVDITVIEFNDATATFQVYDNGSPMNITGMTVNVLFKKHRGDLDSASTTKVYSSAGGSPAVTVTNAATGSCSLAIPDADVTSASTWSFYRVDLINGGVQTTAIYGTVTITTL